MLLHPAVVGLRHLAELDEEPVQNSHHPSKRLVGILLQILVQTLL